MNRFQSTYEVGSLGLHRQVAGERHTIDLLHGRPKSASTTSNTNNVGPSCSSLSCNGFADAS